MSIEQRAGAEYFKMAIQSMEQGESQLDAYQDNERHRRAALKAGQK